MKPKKILIIFACVILALFVLGLCDVIRMGNDAMGQESLGEDRLIGVLVTRDYLDLFDMDGYLNDNIESLMSGGEIDSQKSAEYQGRLYAVLEDETFSSEDTGETTSRRQYVFKDVEGISCFVAYMEDEHGGYSSSSAAEEISDGNVALSYTDEGESITLEGVIYVSTSNYDSFYFNPVYQSASGEVYVLSGNGTSHGGELGEGMSHSMTLDQSISYSSGGETTAYQTNIKITISYIAPPTKILLYQYAAEGQLLHQSEYLPGHLPETISTQPGAEYLVLETQKAGQDGKLESSRALFQKDDENLESFYCRADGICIKQYSAILWS